MSDTQVADITTRSSPQSRIARVLVWLVTAYRVSISPLRPPCCRFSPSCSAYAVEAIQVHGPWRGTWLALRRLSRCHPFHRGGHDPVPPHVDRAGTSRAARSLAESAA